MSKATWVHLHKHVTTQLARALEARICTEAAASSGLDLGSGYQVYIQDLQNIFVVDPKGHRCLIDQCGRLPPEVSKVLTPMKRIIKDFVPRAIALVLPSQTDPLDVMLAAKSKNIRDRLMATAFQQIIVMGRRKSDNALVRARFDGEMFVDADGNRVDLVPTKKLGFAWFTPEEYKQWVQHVQDYNVILLRPDQLRPSEKATAALRVLHALLARARHLLPDATLQQRKRNLFSVIYTLLVKERYVVALATIANFRYPYLFHGSRIRT